MKPEYEFLNLSYTELDSGTPAILVNNEATLPITSLLFTNSFITFSDSDTLIFRLNTLTGNKLSFAVLEELGELSVLELRYENILIGHFVLQELLDIMFTVQSTLKTLKEQSIDV